MPELAADRLVPPPAAGRTFRAERLARFGDLSPGGRLRLDALGRYLQDLSGDDTADAGYDALIPWVVRRLAVEVRADAVFRERLSLCTWCSGTGPRWAERRISVTGDEGASVEAAVLWVHVDPESGAPRPLTPAFLDLYREAAAGRKVSARLQHEASPPSDAERRPWPLRFVDFDPLRHVNNAIYLAAVEEVLASRPDLRAPLRVEVEFRDAIEVGAEVTLAVADTTAPADDADTGFDLWLVGPAATTTFATARVRSL